MPLLPQEIEAGASCLLGPEVCGGAELLVNGKAVANLAADTAAKEAGSGGFNTFSALKNYLGWPGAGNQWHHIVEQSQIGNFVAKEVNNVRNIIAIPREVNQALNGFYSSKQAFTNGMTVRNWLSTQSFHDQYNFGVEQLMKTLGY